MSDSEDEIAEKQFKIVLIGDPATGKTSLAARYCQDDFTRQYLPTAGVDFFLKRTIFPGPRHVTLQIWDIGGQALSGKMLDKYVFGANIVLLVYDISNIMSFDNLEEWLETVRTATVSQERLPMVALVANKCDLEHQRKVRYERHNKFAQEHALTSHVVSARTGDSVALTFQKVVADSMGLRLTRAEQEEHQPVMKAEIVHDEIQEPQAGLTGHVSRSAVCVLQ